jgi:hypothetical protein
MILPEQVEDFARCHGFVPEIELEPGYCCRAYADRNRVLRVPFQGEELTSGGEAAIRLAQAGGPEIFAADPETGALLMERLLPATPFKQRCSPDYLGLDVFRRIRDQVVTLNPDGMSTISDYYGTSYPALDHLIETSPKEVFLHGDLHHENILLDRGHWRPIDPKGLRGDPAFEAVAFLRNALDLIVAPQPLEGLIPQLAEAVESSIDRVVAWYWLDWESWASDPRHTKTAERFAHLMNSAGFPPSGSESGRT